MAVIRGNAAAIRGSAGHTAFNPVTAQHVQRPVNNGESEHIRNDSAYTSNARCEGQSGQSGQAERSQCSSLHSSKNTKHQVAGFSPRLSLGGSGCLQFAVDTHTRSKSPTRISREDSKVLYKCDDNMQVVNDPPSSLAIRPANPLNYVKDPLFVGLPNYSNSCYQNASLQSLMGLFPFLNDMISLLSCPVSSQCRTLCAVAKLMALRQKTVSTSISRHLNDLRDVFADIDPVFCSGEMQDANEFLLRLLGTNKSTK